MKTHTLGYPRIGTNRELKKACEAYWNGEISISELENTGKKIRKANWHLQKENNLDLIPCNDFSYYDQMLDMSLLLGAIPERFEVLHQHGLSDYDLYFAMARGYQKNGHDITALEMTKWFDTNYHYLVPEFHATQVFKASTVRLENTFREAYHELGYKAKPVLIGPVSYLLLGKSKSPGMNTLDLLDTLLPEYAKLIQTLSAKHALSIQLDEPCLSLDLDESARAAYRKAYQYLREKFPYLRLILANYFDCYGTNLDTALALPADVLHLDLVRCPSQLEDILSHPAFRESSQVLSLGIVDGRNIWINDYAKSLALIEKAVARVGIDRVWLATSCSLLHCPCDLDQEISSIPAEVKRWMAFSKQKLKELENLRYIVRHGDTVLAIDLLFQNSQQIEARKRSPLIHREDVQQAVRKMEAKDFRRHSSFSERQQEQEKKLSLPLFPTTTIGSFPQTEEVRKTRAQFKKGAISEAEYREKISGWIADSIRWQETIGLDVLVHGEFERNDMVEYFGEQLDGFTFSENGWVQSYGSRCVKPPIIYGDVRRPKTMTVEWARFAQALTKKPMKGMLTGPVTILQWSFVRDDQPRKDTCFQIALAIREEVQDLERNNISIIQIDEPAIREGLPLRTEHHASYLDWAVKAFQLASSGVADSTQIHTHMCYSEFNDIIASIAAMDADVITIETSRSHMELLDAFTDFQYPNEIGPGVYDIHSPRIPTTEEMELLLVKALEHIPARNLWINPDCGLKTRKWPETEAALKNMVMAANALRKKFQHHPLLA